MAAEPLNGGDSLAYIAATGFLGGVEDPRDQGLTRLFDASAIYPLMKIAVSGAHRTGKTSLVEAMCDALSGYDSVDEPYYLLQEEGHGFAEMPSLEDFERQLEQSIGSIAAAGRDTIFDRCPADILTYLITHRDCSESDVQHWLPRAASAMERLDLVVYVPVERPDRLMSADVDDDRLRRRVDAGLRKILIEDPSAFGVEVLEVRGALKERLHQVLLRIGQAA